VVLCLGKQRRLGQKLPKKLSLLVYQSRALMLRTPKDPDITPPELFYWPHLFFSFFFFWGGGVVGDFLEKHSPTCCQNTGILTANIYHKSTG